MEEQKQKIEGLWPWSWTLRRRSGESAFLWSGRKMLRVLCGYFEHQRRERLKLRRQMAAAAGKKSTTSLSLFTVAHGLEVDEERSTMDTQFWAEGVWTGKWSHEQKEARMRQIREVQTWKKVRGPAGAVMCETRDLGIKWPYWHPLVFSSEITIDMRFACPKDVKKMLVQTARSVYWNKWAAKHEYEEIKEGAWLEPGLALLRKKLKDKWTEKHRNVARKIFLEGRWTQKRLFDTGWSDGCKSVSARHKEEGTEKHRLYHCPEWYEVRRESQRFSESWTKKQGVEVAKRYCYTSSP